ncbi:putative lipoprotein [Myxococcus xanthus DK 1622]|uniref:Lipoprotein n=1 Tax=Myxococcus xanthus (strain DK1622) TaxID=246197 RepID=Q1D2M3_MYXXD|nr:MULTISPECIES: hypothetical protein [Myxococcus]ABF88059.1 putative lipoprotein [Myxococcus xanthus DK 1622]NOJ55296.1 hypothetical protein [Myxococcus xanthus]QPM77464.1 hypothetical protein I5Q59_24435 [Myxococcus xanthus]QVW66531.1 hypothetical protein JTM82_29790 [Myxococcus xanthus DZ2]QZZ52609.1 hypothetical protein MyxoNM_25700 [Myxococcus xanthus]
MKKLNTLGVVGLLSLAAVGCGGEYTPEEEQAMQQPELSDVEQAMESAWIDAGQTRDFSTWLFGVTPFSIQNVGTAPTSYYAYCGSNNISGTVNVGQTHSNLNLNCAWPGARLYVSNTSGTVGTHKLYVWTW